MTEDTGSEQEDLGVFLMALAALKAAEEAQARKRDLQWIVLSFALLRRPREEHAALLETVRSCQSDPQRGEELAQRMRLPRYLQGFQLHRAARGELRGPRAVTSEDVESTSDAGLVAAGSEDRQAFLSLTTLPSKTWPGM